MKRSSFFLLSWNKCGTSYSYNHVVGMQVSFTAMVRSHVPRHGLSVTLLARKTVMTWAMFIRASIRWVWYCACLMLIMIKNQIIELAVRRTRFLPTQPVLPIGDTFIRNKAHRQDQKMTDADPIDSKMRGTTQFNSDNSPKQVPFCRMKWETRLKRFQRPVSATSCVNRT
jgi:hypothetical protein